MTSPHSNSVSDHNILFGMLALQMDLVSRDELISGLQNWMLDKSRRLDELLVEAGIIDKQSQQVLLPLVDLHIRQHEGDAKQSIAAVPVASDVIQQLKAADDCDVQASLAHISTGGRDEDTGPSLAGYSQETLIVKKPAQQLFDGNRFKLIEKHAEGGIGRVSVARDLALNREVAFKELKPAFAHSESARQRFVLEAEITGRLEHPGIVPVYASGRLDDDRPFYAMKFVRGTSLGDAIREYHESYDEQSDRDQTLRFHDLLRRFVSVCQTLDYAHARGVVHRDIKPANIMLGEFGETLVVDWGLAKAIGRPEAAESSAEGTLHPEAKADILATRDGSVVGTIYYMSPEQAAGDIVEVDWLSDVYSLGATLYELLTGVPCLVANQTLEERKRESMDEALRRIREGNFPRPRDALTRVPGALDAICMRAMQRSKADRYQSARQLARDVEFWLADEPISAWVEPLNEQSERFTAQVARGQIYLMLNLADAAEAAFRYGDERKAEYLYRHAQQINDTMHYTINLVPIRDRVRACMRAADVALRLRHAEHAMRYCRAALNAITAMRITDESSTDLSICEAECMLKLATAHRLDRDSADGHEARQKALELVEKVASENPLHLRAQTLLVDLYYQRAEDLCRALRHSDAQALYERASSILRRLVEAGIDSRNSERRLQALKPAIEKCVAMQPLPILLSQPDDEVPRLLSLRNIEQLELGQLGPAVESAETLARLNPESASHFYFAARSFCRCIPELSGGLASDGTSLSESDLAVRALDCLERARTMGFQFSESVTSDPRFAVLHHDERFWDIIGGHPVEVAKPEGSPESTRTGITIVVRDLVASADITLAYNAHQSMRSLIDDVYWLLQGSVPKYSYATTWFLRNEGTGVEYRDADVYSNKLSPKNFQSNDKGGGEYVRFTVARAGIMPGATLRVVKLAAE